MSSQVQEGKVNGRKTTGQAMLGGPLVVRSGITSGLPLTAIHAQIGFIEGKVLTVIDSAISGEQQNKATKDIIKGIFRDQMKWITSLANGYDNGGEFCGYDRVEV